MSLDEKDRVIETKNYKLQKWEIINFLSENDIIMNFLEDAYYKPVYNYNQNVEEPWEIVDVEFELKNNWSPMCIGDHI